ncbi:MAG: aminomethyl-transferring glycine dehydrogenase subunit GcvPA [Candidatus Omnitrophica bacterium]|nr:aminomethyl-transferring glycine dehydrogenase subunit GcvPA [Candidatus Omnitrophota bacterium]
MEFVPITKQDQEVMLAKIGVCSMEELLKCIPSSVTRARLRLPPGLSEPELLRVAERLASRNATSKSHVSFLGAGAYEHFVSSVVRYVFSRGEFLTAYTPYQPEASQGTLQAMYEFQSLICDLTQMDAANASLYEGGSAMAEACILALRETERRKLVVSGTLHPEVRQTLSTYLKQVGTQIQEIPRADGISDIKEAGRLIDSQTAAVVVQMPNAFGCLEPVRELEKAAHARGALLIVSVNPVSLGILEPPGAYGADIVVGEGQPLGTDLLYGGPYLGLFACRKELIRKMPGRVIGMTRDAHGRRGFVLTLQTREQHIRRARATSNICTNEAMMALAAAVHLGSLGKEGFREVAFQNLQKAHYCLDRLSTVRGVQPLFKAPFFNEFAVSLPADPEEVNGRLLEKGFLGGLPLRRWDPSLRSGWLLAVTEARSREQIDRFVQAVQEILS